MTREERIRQIREDCWREAKARDTKRTETMSLTGPAWLKKDRSW